MLILLKLMFANIIRFLSNFTELRFYNSELVLLLQCALAVLIQKYYKMANLKQQAVLSVGIEHTRSL